MPANRNPSPPRSRLRARSSGVNAAAVRRLAAQHATAVRGPDSREVKSPEEQSSADAAEAAALAGDPNIAVDEDDAAGQDDAADEDDAAGQDDAADEDQAVDEDAADEDVADEDDAGRARSSRRMITLMVLGVVTLALGGLAAWFGTQASSLNGEPSAQNLALSDTGETSQVTSQMTSAVGALFSYNYANPGPTSSAASRLLTGAAVGKYATMIAGVKADAQKDKLVVTTKVSNIGVEVLTPDTARLLVFATESEGTAGAAAPTTAEAMLAVNAVRVGSAWKISGIDTFNG